MDDISYLRNAVLDIINLLDISQESGDIATDFQPLMSKLDYIQRLAVSLNLDESVTELVGHAYTMLGQIEEGNKVECSGYKAPLKNVGRSGRPSYDISEDQLLFLLEQGFQVRDVSNILGVSTRTIERRMSTFGLSVLGQCLST